MACASAPKPRVQVESTARLATATDESPALAADSGVAARGLTSAALEAIDLEALRASLTLEQKVGQLMMVGFGGLEVDESVSELLLQKHVGGLCLFGRNIKSARQLATLNDDLQRVPQDGIPLFIAVDQEGGNVVRIDDGNTVLPGNMALGATRDVILAFRAGFTLGADLKRLGFNMNLAPVLDVNSNPKNPVIGVRAFSDNVSLVSEMGTAFVRGQQEANIASVAKHFPGHGSVDSDSHSGLPVASGTAAQLRAQFKPFEAAIAVGLDGMMTAHIATPALTFDETPATLSPKVLGEVLRNEMKFDGLVLTDELEMDAIDRRYGVGKAAVLAVNAGADMVLIPWRKEKKTEVWEALVQAAQTQQISSARLDQAVDRILKLKAKRGVFGAPLALADRLSSLGKERQVADDIAKSAVTLLRAKAGLFPLPENSKLAVVTAEKQLVDRLAETRAVVGSLVIPTFPKDAQREALKRAVVTLSAKADVVLVTVHNSRHLELVTNAKLSGKKVVAVVLGLPYLAAMVPEADVVIATYSYRASAIRAVAAALLGEQGTPGRLPVSLQRMPFGYRLDSGAVKHEGPGGARESERSPLKAMR